MVSDEQLIADLKTFADELGKTPTQKQMNDSGPWDESTYRNHFGTWNNALQSAGLGVNNEYSESKEQLIEDLQQFAEELGKTPTRWEMDDSGPWDSTTYINNFGTWNDALQEAGLEINKNIEYVESKEQLIEDLQEFAEELGKTPTQKQMNESGPWSTDTYERRFGTWNNALREADLEVNCLGPEERAGVGEGAYGEDYYKKRSETLERDNYICKVCDTTDDLHCHHIKPRREFDNVNDSNTLDNLITLCRSCHSTFEGRWQDSDPDEFAARAKEYIATTT